MASGIWTTEYFNCPNCGLPYTATREQHPNKHSGSFSCEVCGSKVHAWSGNYDFFDWKVDQARSPMFGKGGGCPTSPQKTARRPASASESRYRLRHELRPN